MVNTKHEIQPIKQSKSRFFACYETSFSVLPRESLLVGVEKIDKLKPSNLVLERTQGQTPPVKFGVHEAKIFSISASQDLNSLITGDNHGRLIQYSIGNLFTTPPKMIRDFGDLKLGPVISTVIFKHIAAVGGEKSKFLLLNLKTREILCSPVRTSIQYIDSLQFCQIQKGFKVALIIVGTSHSSWESHLFDVSFRRKS